MLVASVYSLMDVSENCCAFYNAALLKLCRFVLLKLFVYMDVCACV
jgi:hypothetical protein